MRPKRPAERRPTLALSPARYELHEVGIALFTGLRRPQPRPGSRSRATKGAVMNLLLAIIAVVAIVLLVTGGLASSLNFLLWVGLVLLIIAAIIWLTRYIGGRRAL